MSCKDIKRLQELLDKACGGDGMFTTARLTYKEQREFNDLSQEYDDWTGRHNTGRGGFYA